MCPESTGETRRDAAQEDCIHVEDRIAGAYLTRADRELRACGNPRRLYAAKDVELADLSDQEAFSRRLTAHTRAQGRQLDFARVSILFSGLAAEAYINETLARCLGESDREGLEKLRVEDKYPDRRYLLPEHERDPGRPRGHAAGAPHWQGVMYPANRRVAQAGRLTT